MSFRMYWIVRYGTACLLVATGCGGHLDRIDAAKPPGISEQNRVRLKQAPCLAVLPIMTDKTDVVGEEIGKNTDVGKKAKSQIAKAFRSKLLRYGATSKPPWLDDGAGCTGPEVRTTLTSLTDSSAEFAVQIAEGEELLLDYSSTSYAIRTGLQTPRFEDMGQIASREFWVLVDALTRD